MADLSKYNEEENYFRNRVDLIELIESIWDKKFFVLTFTAIFSVISIFYSLSLPNIYKSTTMLSPASENVQNGLGAASGNLGGLASLAGINLGGSMGVDKTQLAVEVLKSRKFIGDFIERHNILPDLMAVNEWDLATNELTYATELYDPDTDTWSRSVEPPFNPKPSNQEAYKIFIDLLEVVPYPETGMYEVSISHLSPYIAQSWLNLLIADLNETMRAREREEANKSIEYLESQLGKTEISDMQSILYELIEEQMKVLMFAEVRDEYSFKTIDPPVAPELKDRPSRALICVLITFLGGCIAVFSVLVRYFVKRSRLDAEF